jgi:integrase
VLPGAHRVASGGRVYWYAYRGGPRLWSGRPEDEAAAAVEIASAYVEERRQTPADGTVAKVIDAYRRSPEWLRLAAKTRSEWERSLEPIRTRWGSYSGREFTGAGPELLAWRDQIMADRGPRAADMAMQVVSRLCSWGRAPARRLLPTDCRPKDGIERVYVAPAKTPPSLTEIQAAIDSLPAHLSQALALALYTGLRRGDLCAVDWAAVEPAAGRILWSPSKSRRRQRRVVIPIKAGLRALLDAIGPADRGPILLNSYGRPWTASGLQASLGPALDALGYAWRLHDLRRACATKLVAEGWTSRQVARVLGWSEAECEAMTAIYVDDATAISGPRL